MIKLFSIITVWWLFCFPLAADPPGKAFLDGVPDPAALIEEIFVITPTDWSITIRKNGSSYLNYGSGPLDVARIPQEKVSLGDIYNKISTGLVSNPKDISGKIAIPINLKINKESKIGGNLVQYIEIDEIYKIFEDLVGRAIPYDQNRFEMILNYSPIDPKRRLKYSYNKDGVLEMTPALKDEVESSMNSAQPESGTLEWEITEKEQPSESPDDVGTYAPETKPEKRDDTNAEESHPETGEAGRIFRLGLLAFVLVAGIAAWRWLTPKRS
jgi:hypothetical protein